MENLHKEQDYMFLNDFEDIIGDDYTNLNVYYDKNKCTYKIGIETILLFNSKIEEASYYESLLNVFTDYMIDNNLSTCKPVGIDLLIKGIYDREFKDIESLYTVFKINIENYVNQLMNK